MKKTIKIFLLVLILFFTGCSPKQEDPTDEEWDKIGGGGVGEEVEEEDIVIEDLPTNEEAEDKKENNESENSEVIEIDLNNLVENEHYTFENNLLTISKDGIYSLSGNLNGAVCVEGDADHIQIILNNANIVTLDSQNCAALVFKKNNGERILTVSSDTLNSLSDSIGDTEDDDAAVIQAKKSSLVINGSGLLKLKANGEDTTGIKVKNELSINDTHIIIEAVNNGIKAGTTLSIHDATLEIKSGNDAIKTDVEAETEEEGDLYTKDPFAGYIYISNCNIDIVSSDNGIKANSYLKIENSEDNLIKIVTNGGAPATITETSSDNADGKAISVGGIELVTEMGESDLPSQCEDNYILLISGGTYELNSNDDAISSKGNIIINGGTFNISSGDDAIHAEYLTTIKTGTITISKCYEGIEGAAVEIYDGNIIVKSIDDGINAANADLTNYSYNIYIAGGTIIIDASGDGVDSNGTIEFVGGYTVIYGPTRNDNAALDADRGILVNGGTLIALGTAGMVETPATNSKQYCLVYNLTSKASANSKLELKDKNGNVLLDTINAKEYQSIVISTSDFKLNESYTITVGSTSNTFTITQIITKIGTSMGPGGGPGNRPSGPGGSRPR